MADGYQARPRRANIKVDKRKGFAIDVVLWKRVRKGTRDAYILAYALEAFGFVNVMFFTLGGAGPSAARRDLVARFRPDCQRFTASRRLSCTDLGEVSRAATGAERRIPQSRPTRASTWARRVMVDKEYSTPFPHLILYGPKYDGVIG